MPARQPPADEEGNLPEVLPPEVLDLAKLEGSPAKSYLMRVRVARNLRRFPLPAAMAVEQRCMMEKLVLNLAVNELIANKDFGGKYHSLTPGHPNLIGVPTHEKLVADHLMFKDFSGDKCRASAGIALDWPHGRGCYISADSSVVMWVGHEDHLTIMSIHSGSVINQVFGRLEAALDVLQSVGGIEFAISPDYGAVTSCPTNIGTGPTVARDQEAGPVQHFVRFYSRRPARREELRVLLLPCCP